MTRREAITTVVAAVAGHVGTSQRLSIADYSQPTALSFHLGAYRTYTFTEGDRTAVFTPKELMDAIMHTHTLPSSAGVLLSLRCLTCGELVSAK